MSAVLVSHNRHHFAVFSGQHPLIQSGQSVFYSFHQTIYKKKSKDSFNQDISMLSLCLDQSIVRVIAVYHMITAYHVSDQQYPLPMHVCTRSRPLSLFIVGHNSLMNSPYLFMSNTEQWVVLNTGDFSQVRLYRSP